MSYAIALPIVTDLVILIFSKWQQIDEHPYTNSLDFFTWYRDLDAVMVAQRRTNALFETDWHLALHSLQLPVNEIPKE